MPLILKVICNPGPCALNFASSDSAGFFWRRVDLSVCKLIGLPNIEYWHVRIPIT